MTQRRLFFGFEVKAPWETPFPKGRLIPTESLHLTLAFLGDTDFKSQIPPPPEFIGQCGICPKLLFLPEHNPRVVALEVDFFNPFVLEYQKALSLWLESLGYTLDARPFLPHVTLARAPFEVKEWKYSFAPIPFMTTSLNLYESHDNLIYKKLWTHPLVLPIEEFEHIADLAFHIRGKTVHEMYLNAQTALAFLFPPLVQYFDRHTKVSTLDDLIIHLNQVVSQTDIHEGCPFKAVSFHGKITELNSSILHWEMIIDV